jgi:SAM-dependent methyltransferase
VIEATIPVDFACPIHKVALGSELFCAECNRRYPAVDGIPILINEAGSVFRISDYLDPKQAYGGASSYAGHLDRRTGLRQLYRRLVYRLSEAGPPRRDYDVDNAVDHIRASVPEARILVVGAGDTALPGSVVYTDVAFGKNVSCIADAHDLPFLAQSFDACIACAVLEHVVDPYRCVGEMIRVLRPGGFVYAETPFMQPVHMREHDFTRFTHLGHRRLFRNFDEIRSGIVGGPGMSAGQMLRYAMVASSGRPVLRKWLRLVSMLVTYPLRWLDLLSYSKPGGYDSASAFYFFGTLRGGPISDRELLGFYRGT